MPIPHPALIGAALLSVLATCLPGCAPHRHAPLATVGQVELIRYTGRWYEIAMLPNRFQASCVSDTQAHYRLDGEEVRVTNRCRRADGTVDAADGIAKVVADSGNAKLRVSFFRPFYGDYWILALDPDYQWVLVGEPSRTYAWVLSRRPVLEDTALEAALAAAVKAGYDRAAFRLTPQREPID